VARKKGGLFYGHHVDPQVDKAAVRVGAFYDFLKRSLSRLGSRVNSYDQYSAACCGGIVLINGMLLQLGCNSNLKAFDPAL
jgi:hypothetical protein